MRKPVLVGHTWNAVPFRMGSSSPAGSPADNRRADVSAIDPYSSFLLAPCKKTTHARSQEMHNIEVADEVAYRPGVDDEFQPLVKLRCIELDRHCEPPRMFVAGPGGGGMSSRSAARSTGGTQ